MITGTFGSNIKVSNSVLPVSEDGLIRSMTLVKESSNGHTQIYPSGVKSTERYDEHGNTIFRNYINPDLSGWQEQFEFVNGKQVKTDKSDVKNGKFVNRIVTTVKEKGKKLIQYYDDSDEIYKEEFNQKTRTKKNGVWSEWEY